MPSNKKSQGNTNSTDKKRPNSPDPVLSSQKKRNNIHSSKKEESGGKNLNNLGKKNSGNGDKFSTPNKFLNSVSDYYEGWDMIVDEKLTTILLLISLHKKFCINFTG